MNDEQVRCEHCGCMVDKERFGHCAVGMCDHCYFEITCGKSDDWSDDWSLKKLFLEIESHSGKYGMQCNCSDIEDIIEEHLETLRQKLIKDIQMELYVENGMEFLHGVCEIINKLFGVEYE